MLGKLHIKGRKRVPINTRKPTLCFPGTVQLRFDPVSSKLIPLGFYMWGP